MFTGFPVLRTFNDVINVVRYDFLCVLNSERSYVKNHKLFLNSLGLMPYSFLNTREK